MLAISYMMLQGTPYVYQGQEIGMTNKQFEDINEFKDVMVAYIRKVFGVFEPIFRKLIVKVLNKRARDHARMPMQWNDKEYAGFSTVEPWMCINPNYKEINVEEAMKDPDSIYYFYKKVIDFRKNSPLVRYGTFKEHYKSSDDVYCYERWWEGERLLIICNFKNNEVPFDIPDDMVYTECELKLHNYGYDRPKAQSMVLRPYEAAVYILK